MFEKQIKFAREHIILTAANHVAAGFGLALLLQHYLVGSSFLPAIIAWLLVGFSAAVHSYVFIAPSIRQF